MSTKEGLQKALKPLYMRYSQYINKQQANKEDDDTAEKLIQFA